MKQPLVWIVLAFWISPLAASRLQDGLAAGGVQNWTARYNAGFDALEKGRYSDAAEHFQSVIQDAEHVGRESNRMAMSLYGLGLSRYRQNEFAVAASLFGKSLGILERNLGSEHPDVVRIVENLAAALQKAGVFADAERQYRRVLAVRGGAPSGLELEGVLPTIEGFLSLLSSGSLKDSHLEGERRKFRRTIREAKLGNDLYGFMLKQLEFAELTEEAESVMLSAVETLPDSRQVRLDLAEMYIRSGKFEKAIEAFKAALQASGKPDPAQDRSQRSIIYRRIGRVNGLLFRLDSALSAYKTALELAPDSAETLIGLGDLYGSYEQLDDALAQYNRAAALGPETAGVFAAMADASLRLGRFSESSVAAAKALELDPKMQRARYVLATALMRSNRREEGERVLSEYRKRQADEAVQNDRLQEVSKVNRRVNVMLARGQSHDAAALLRESVRLYPEATGLLLRLGQVVSKLGQHDEAAALLRSLIDSGPDDYLVHWIIASEYEMLGDTRASQQHRVLCFQLISGALRPRTN